MLPPLRTVKAGLHRTTEALATELAAPGVDSATPAWSALEWQLASAAAAAHGVAPLLCKFSDWQNPQWRKFVDSQHEHVLQRHQDIATLLERIDAAARDAWIPIVPLKGAALHALKVYLPGERPMADIDLLVRSCDVEATSGLLQALGFVEAYVTWQHRVFKPASGHPAAVLGEHRDTQITIELHTRIQERLPISTVDITQRIYPNKPYRGLNPYPSIGALMSHLLLHTAGNICSRTARLLHLNDIARLGARMTTADWNVLWDEESPWWALPPLWLTTRYFCDAVPTAVLDRLESHCPAILRMVSRRQTLTQASCSGLWIQAVPGIEWCRSISEAGRYLKSRFRPSAEAIRERAELTRSQPWLDGQSWARLSRGRQILVRLTRPVARMDTLHVVRAAITHYAGSR